LYTLTLHAAARKQWKRLQNEFYPLETDEQTTCLALYNEFIVSPFRAAFPEETLFCEPSALFSDGNAPTVAAKVLVIGFFATSRFFQETGERKPAVMRDVKGSSGRCHSEWVVQQFIYTNTKVALKCNTPAFRLFLCIEIHFI
jgi:hypothetical protein